MPTIKIQRKGGGCGSTSSEKSAGRPGTELKRLLRWWRILPRSGCKCNKRARLMDRRGADWCEANIEEIVDWLAEAAAERSIPFARWMARRVVRRAIKRARAKAAESG
jgi:hypothetical protein